MGAHLDSGVELLHLVARAAHGARPLRTRAACADLWSRLGVRFDVVACALMPDHVHLFACVERAGALRSFAQILASFRARMACGPDRDVFEWEPLPQPQAVRSDPRHIARTIRYVHLNPVRDALCDDPLQWEWSTHRDWMGAVSPPCADVRRWGRVLGRAPSTRGEWLHEFVCADASVRRPRPLADPRPYLGATSADASLAVLAESVARVACSARSAAAEFDIRERRLYLLSAARWTRYRAPELARSIGRHPTSVRRFLQGVEAVADASGDTTAAATTTSASTRHRMTGGEARAIALSLADERLRWNGLSSAFR